MKYYIETYGCQMNVADSEIVSSILDNEGYEKTSNINEADIILVNTCSIRQNAENRVIGRIQQFKTYKEKNNALIGILGCMAERLKSELIEKYQTIDFVVGPDNYRDLPQILEQVQEGQKIVNTILSENETYENIIPVRFHSNGISAFVAITRGCQNFCSYCIVPYVRGTERSRSPETIIQEIQDLENKGFKEVYLIGQNVDSYRYNNFNFASLLKLVAETFPHLRIRFSTNHPKDFNEEVIKTITAYENICKHIHLPVQSGSNAILQLMNRGYTRESYLEIIHKIKKHIPDCAITTDILVGFCNETLEDHEQTLRLMEEVEYDMAYMFKYSERSGTYAARYLKDNVPEKEKIRRLNEVIELQNKISYTVKQNDVGKTFSVLVEGFSKKSKQEYMGRNCQNKVVVFPSEKPINKGTYVTVKIENHTPATLIGKIINYE